jgi:hypothetical protein
MRARLLRDTPTPELALLKRLYAYVAVFLNKYVPSKQPMSYEEWKLTTSYDEGRLAQLDCAYHSLRGGMPTRRQCSHVDSFGKSEAYLLYKYLRLINSRSDFFKVFSGPAFKTVESILYMLPWFIKHVPKPEWPDLVRALKKAGLHVYQVDYTAFESHFRRAIMHIECMLYRHVLKGWEGLDLLCDTLMGVNRMRTRSGVRATVTARRMSGDMCTSLGNGFCNLMIAKFLAHEQGHELEGFVEGDDGLFVTDAKLTADMFYRVGFTVKIDEVADPCKASFCGMVFSEAGEIIRDPRRFMMTFGWTQSFIHGGPALMDQLLRAKALSCVYETPQCPIIGVMARQALHLTSHVHPRFVNDGYHGQPPDVINLPPFNPHPSTRVLFEEIYGVSVKCQLAAEDMIRSGRLVDVASLIPPSSDQLHYASHYVVVD